MAAQRPRLTCSDAWVVFNRLANEQQDIARVIYRCLPKQARQHLRGACHALRSLANASTRGVDIPSGFVGESALCIAARFPHADTLVLRQGKLSAEAFCAVLRECLCGSITRQLVDLRVVAFPTDCVGLWGNAEPLKQVAAQVMQLLPALPKLTWLQLTSDDYHSGYPRPDMAVPALSPLIELKLQWLALNDATALPAARLQELQALNLETCKMTGDSEPWWGAMSQLRSLTRLRLRHLHGFNGQRVSALVQLSKLQHLELWERDEPGDYQAVSALRHLTYLAMVDLAEEHVEYLTALRALRSLNLRDTPLRGAGLQVLTLPHLTHLAVDSAASTADCIQRVTTTLRSLDLTIREGCLTGWVMSVAAGALPAQLTNLEVEYADMGKRPRTADLHALAMFTNLRNLSLVFNTTDDLLHTNSLTQLTRLTSFDVWGSACNSELVWGLMYLTRLVNISIDNCAVTDMDLIPLLALPRLAMVELCDLPLITPAVLAALLTGVAASLRKVQISECEHITEDGVADACWRLLDRYRERLPALQELSIDFCRML